MSIITVLNTVSIYYLLMSLNCCDAQDMPTSLPEGMVIGAILEREDPRDSVLLHPDYHGKAKLADLPAGSVMGECFFYCRFIEFFVDSHEIYGEQRSYTYQHSRLLSVVTFTQLLKVILPHN